MVLPLPEKPHIRIRPTGLGHVGTAATALAAKRLGTNAHEINRRVGRFEVFCDTDGEAGFAILSDTDNDDDAAFNL